MYAVLNDEKTNHQIQRKIIRKLRLTGTLAKTHDMYTDKTVTA